MKKKGMYLLLGLIMFFVILPIKSTAIEKEELVYIPDSIVRSSIVQEIIDNMMEDNPYYEDDKDSPLLKYELPSKQEMLRIKKLQLPTSDSIEGLQYASNLEDLYNSFPQKDLTPISKLTNLKRYDGYHAIMPDNSIFPLEIFSNLKKIEYINLVAGSVIDTSVLDDLPNLTYYYSHGSSPIELSKAYINKENQKLMIENPMTFTKKITNFNIVATGYTDSNESKSLNIQQKENTLIIEKLDQSINKIDISIEGESSNFDWSSSKGFHMGQNFEIELVWY